jgi:hypothetical protein
MINPVVRAFNHPKRLNFCDTTKFQSHAVAALIISNAILRPVATELDPSASDKEKHYSAAREFFHQSMCLMCHYMLSPLFEKAAFHVGKQFPKLKETFGEYTSLKKVKDALQFNVDARRNNRLVFAKMKEGEVLGYKEIPRKLLGVLRIGGTVGTVLALGVAAPTLNNHLLKPILKLLHFDQGKPSEESSSLDPQVPSALPTAFK